MVRSVRLGVGCIMLCLAGCGSNYSKHETLANDYVHTMNQVISTLESITDGDSAKAAAGKLDKLCDDLESLKKRSEALPKLSTEENDKLNQALKPEMEKMMQRMRSATLQSGIKSGNEPAFLKVVQRMSTLGRSSQSK